MVGTLQPLDEKFPIVGEDGRPTIYFIKWAQQRQIDITDAITAEEALQIVVDYVAAHPVSATWGDITGTLSAQTDLQAALDGKLTVAFNPSWGTPDAKFYVDAFTAGDPSVTGSTTLAPSYDGVNPGFQQFDILGFVGGGYLGGVLSSSGRITLSVYGSVPGWEFNQDPYVTTFKIFHEGNLSFGSGLSYDAGTGVLTASGGSGGVLPVVDGSIPPVFLQNPDGSLIYAPI